MSDFTPLSELKRQLRKNLSQTIHRELVLRCEKISLEASVEFIKEMEHNLDKATPAPESQHLINNIKKSFEIRQVKRRVNGETLKGFNVHIPIDRNGLVMYLEYGTGLTGKAHKHPHMDFSKLDFSMFPSNGEKKQIVGWNYAVNYGKSRLRPVRNRYNTFSAILVPYYTKMDGREGFIFKKKPNSYIDSDDIQFQNKFETKYSWVEGYEIKKGKNKGKWVKPYIRHHKNKMTYTSKNTYVFSSGLKSVHFIYDAKHSVFNKIKNK